MQGAGNRSKSIVAVLAGVSTGLGIAFLVRKTACMFFSRYFRTSGKPFWNMTIDVASNETQCLKLVNELKRDIEVSKVLGFDCEWVTIDDKRHPVALVQLATREGRCGLFQLHLYSSVPILLQDLLQDRSILKVGVAPETDRDHLLSDYGVEVSGILDIRHLVDLSHGRDTVGGLAAIVMSELGVELPKDLSVRVSNWEAIELTRDQEEYAAKDALASVLAFNNLIEKKVKVPFFCSKKDQWNKIYEYCLPLVGVPFKEKKKLTSSDFAASSKEPTSRPKSGQPHSSTPPLEGKRSYRAFSPRKSPLYENAFMLAPDGVVLCTCDTKKAEWYVSRGLAVIVENNPLKIQLLFTPRSRIEGPSAEYYTLEKQNLCVACGRDDGYVRKKVVPHEYRRYFPVCMKARQSHDILLLCTRCHVKSNVEDLKLKVELGLLCNAPIGSDENAKLIEVNKNKTLRSAARALLNKTHVLPETRQRELIKILEENLQCEVTPNILNELKDLDTRVPNEDYTPHGLLVVEYFARDGIKGLMKLEKMWREHFLDAMEPRFMPPLWSVNHYHEHEPEFFFDSEFLERIKSLPSRKQ